MGKTEIDQLKLWLSDKFENSTKESDDQNKKIDSLINRFDKYEEQLFEVIITVSKLEKENVDLREENQKMKTQMNEIDARTRARNLRFHIPDDEKNTPLQTVGEFISNNLKVEDKKPLNARRIITTNPASKKRTTQIVAQFMNEQDASVIKSAAYKRPKGSRGSVEDDLPIEWAQIRKSAYETHVKPAKAQSKKIRWFGDKLFIDNIRINLKPKQLTIPTTTDEDENYYTPTRTRPNSASSTSTITSKLIQRLKPGSSRSSNSPPKNK